MIHSSPIKEQHWAESCGKRATVCQIFFGGVVMCSFSSKLELTIPQDCKDSTAM